MKLFDEQLALLNDALLYDLQGTVREVRGMAIRVEGLHVPIGAMVSIEPRCSPGVSIEGEVVGFQGQQTIIMLFGTTSGIRAGDPVHAQQFSQTVAVGDELLGRVLDGLGRPIDGKGSLRANHIRPLQPDPVDPMIRPLIDEPLATGVRAIDTLTSVGRGQRIGAFAPPGVGKSTLMGMMARGTAADVSVVALVGERGREVRDFIDNQLGPEGMQHTVVVCATGDESPLLRIRAAWVATTVAEYFRDRGKDVLLIMDSLTRFCQAQRQVGLATGEPPTTKGYTPSVFSMLPTLLERSGRTPTGSITGFYAVLVEGEEIDDPIADAARGVLDGHIGLSRDLAHKGHWPAVDVVKSISRVADDVTTPAHQVAAATIRRLVSAYEQVEDLLNIGAYTSGSNPDFDLAIACKPAIDQLLQQSRAEAGALSDFERTSKQLFALTQNIKTVRQRLEQPAGRAARGPAASS